MFPLRFNNFLACACLSDFLRYPCSFMTFLMNVFVIPSLPFFFFCICTSAALLRSLSLCLISLPFRSLPSRVPPLSFELSGLPLRSHINSHPFLQFCHAARSHHKTPCKSMPSIAIPDSLHDHAKLSIPLGLSNSFIIFVPLSPPHYP